MQESIAKEVKGDLQKSFLVLGTHICLSCIHIIYAYVYFCSTFEVNCNSVGLFYCMYKLWNTKDNHLSTTERVTVDIYSVFLLLQLNALKTNSCTLPSDSMKPWRYCAVLFLLLEMWLFWGPDFVFLFLEQKYICLWKNNFAAGTQNFKLAKAILQQRYISCWS